MKKYFIALCILVLCIGFSTNVFSQKVNPITYDNCLDAVSNKAQKQFTKAYNLYQKGSLSESSQILREIISKEDGFASPFFLLGMIGVRTGNNQTIEKMFQKCHEVCPDYSASLLYYYLGVISYSNEKWEESTKYFKHFKEIALSDSTISDSLFNEADNYMQWSDFISQTKNNPVPFSPKQITNICTQWDEYLPFISLDLQHIYFTRRMQVKTDTSYTFYESNNTVQKELFSIATKNTDGSYDKGFPLDEPFNMVYNEGGATLTADNKELYYTVCKPEKDYINCDIYYSNWLGEYWSDIKSVGTSINSPTSWESQPCISPDGKTLFFSSNRPGGYGGTDIWISKKQTDGSWSKPINAGVRINTPGNEKAPFLHPDGSSFYFSSTGWRGMGGYDLFFLRLDDRNMKKPKNLGYPINTEGDEIGVYVTLGNEMAYFASNSLNQNHDWDIYSFDMPEGFIPKKAKLIKGNVKDKEGDLNGASLELTRLSDKEKQIYNIDTQTGDFSAVILENENYLLKAKKEGYAFESKRIEANSNTQDTIHMVFSPLEVGERYEINDILFATGSWEITQQSMEVIDAFIDYLNEYPKIRCTIEGYTDNIGKDEDNLLLSEKRAKAVADYIIKNRIREDRIHHQGYGAKNPATSNATESGRAKNRRTVFRIDSM